MPSGPISSLWRPIDAVGRAGPHHDSHVLAELERVADYLVLVSHGKIQVAGEVEDLLATHGLLTGPASESERYTRQWNVVHASSAASLVRLLVRYDGTSDPVPPGWEARAVTLEELTLAPAWLESRRGRR